MLFVPRPRALRRKHPSLLDVVLAPAQRAVVDGPTGPALLVLGEAGHGKTTVALHRLVHLWRARPRDVRALVVVPTEALGHLIEVALRRLGADIDVTTYDLWASSEARRAFRRLPRESDSTPASVMRLKRHPALRLALEELATRSAGRIDDDRDAPAPRSRKLVSRGDLQHLFGDRLLLERVSLSGRLPAGVVADVLDRTRAQFGATAEEEWAHVLDRQRLVAVDHRRLDEGTSSENAKTVDVEDYAVLFELERLRAARQGRAPTAPRPLDLLMIDEAQELAPLELALLGRSLHAHSTLIVAGDADQQTDSTAAFEGWRSTMRALGRAEHDAVELEIGYRCPAPVAALARAIVRRSPRTARTSAAAEGVPPVFVRFDDERALLVSLGRDLAELARRDPRASVAVVCRAPATARRIQDGLRLHGAATRLVLDGRFLPRGPAQVTTADEVKGLEFDFVLVPDASAEVYPDERATRRVLYVAVTRARHQVALACVGERTQIVPREPLARLAP